MDFTTYLVVPVHISELPLVTGDTHPLKLRPQVDELPSFLSLLVILFGVVGESIKLFIAYCAEKKNREKPIKHRQMRKHYLICQCISV